MAHEVDQPTYEIVGPVKRFDERDTVFAREHLVPGSASEIEYHAANPEQVAIDRKLTAYIQEKTGQSQKQSDWRCMAYYKATFGPIATLGKPDEVDGKVAPEQVSLPAVEATKRIKEMARFLGAARVRISRLKPEWVYSHRGCPPFHDRYEPHPPFADGVPADYKDLKWGDPVHLPHRYAISMAFPQKEELMRTSPSPVADLEVGRVYAQCALTAVQLARFIRCLGYPARAHHLRNSGVMLVPVAADAGLGELARSGYLLAKGLGLNFRLACVTTDLDLIPDKPIDIGVQDFCEKCLKCATTCPAGAIPKEGKRTVNGSRRWKLDGEKCLLYWGKTGAACAVCQTVCPWSKPDNLLHGTVTEMAVHLPACRRALVWADDLVYGKKHKPKTAPDWLDLPGNGA